MFSDTTITDADIHELVEKFGTNFFAIIQKLESMIRDAKNKNSNLTIGNITSHDNLSSSASSASSAPSTYNSSNSNSNTNSPSIQPSTNSINPLNSGTSQNNTSPSAPQFVPLANPSNVGPPGGPPGGPPSGTPVPLGGPLPSNFGPPVPSAPEVNPVNSVNPDIEPIADNNTENNLHPSPDPSSSSSIGLPTHAIPIGQINILPDELNNHPSPEPFTITMKELEDRLNKLKEDDMSVSPSETDKKLELVYDINRLLAQHLNIINQISNKTPQLNYAYNLFLNMLTNSLTNINTTHNQKVGKFNIMIPRNPDMELINIRLQKVTIDNLKELKQFLDEFKENADSIEQTKTLVDIYNISKKIPIFYILNGKATLPQPVIIEPQSEINVNNTDNTLDTPEITQLKQQVLDIIKANISQLEQLSSELLTKHMELQQILTEYDIDNNSDEINQAYAISKSLIQYNGMVIQQIDGENMFSQLINDPNITTDRLNERIKNGSKKLDSLRLTIMPAIENANQIIQQLKLATTQPPSPPNSPDSSTDSLSYSTTTSVGDSSLIGLKLVNQSEYNGEIQRISKQIKELQNQVTNPSYGNNIFKVLDDILNMLNIISSKETTLLTTETNKKYMNNILIELSSIVKLISFCKLSNKPGYCDTINTIPSNIPNTSIDNVTSEFVDTNLPQIYAYVTQVFNNIVSNVKNEAQSYIETLEKLSSNGVSDDITNQINEVLGKIITFMRGGIIKDIKEVDGNVLPNTEFTDIIGIIATLLNSVLNYRTDPNYIKDVNDIQFYLLKTVSNMLNCMFINDDNKTDCAKEGAIQNEIKNVNEIIKKYNVSGIELDDITTIRNELARLFPGVTVPTLQDRPSFTFNPDDNDDASNMTNSTGTLKHPFGFNQSVSSINTSDSSSLSDGTDRSTDTSINNIDGGIIQNDQDIIDSHLENSLNNSGISDLTNSSMTNSSMTNSSMTREIPNEIAESVGSINTTETELSGRTGRSTDTRDNETNDDVIKNNQTDVDYANIQHIKQSINETISKFTELNERLNSNNNFLDNNKYIFWDKTDNTPTMKLTRTTSQIISTITNNNEYFVKLLQLLRDKLNADHLINEPSITKLLGEINALISSTGDRFDYKDYEVSLKSLYNDLRKLMINTLHIEITDNTTYPQKLSGGGINDKIRFTYKNKRGTKKAKKSKPTRRRKYTPHKKNYYY
jgi:hypothetical protein